MWDWAFCASSAERKAGGLDSTINLGTKLHLAMFYQQGAGECSASCVLLEGLGPGNRRIRYH